MSLKVLSIDLDGELGVERAIGVIVAGTLLQRVGYPLTMENLETMWTAFGKLSDQ